MAPALGDEQVMRILCRDMRDAVAQQAATLLNPGPAFHNLPAMRLAEKLTAHSGFDHVFFASSGAEANEGAIKLARKWGQLRT